MSEKLTTLLQALNEELQPQLFKDYCPNGLQVEGRKQVTRIIGGVTACQALIDQAIALDADAVLVHHGYFWKGEEPSIIGMKRRRIESLLKHGISLIAYHLPLDAHPEMGNNAQLAQRMGWQTEGGMEAGKLHSVGNWGRVADPVSLEALGKSMDQTLGRQPLLVKGGSHPIKTLAWCTGGAQRMIEQAYELGVDAYVTGEISESTVHFARENGIHFISAGHHATERYGVQALGQWLADTFDIEYQFVDIDSPA